MILAAGLAIYPASQNKTSNHSDTPSESQSKQHTNALISAESEPPNYTTNNYQTQAPEKHRDWLETTYYYSAPFSCFLSIITAWALIAQIRNHAKAERPWVLLSVADEQTEFIDQKTGFMPAAYWKVKNFGKTPALIDAIRGAVTVVTSVDTIPDLDFVPPYEIALEPVIAPGQESSYVSFRMKEPISKEAANGLISLVSPTHFLVMAGRIEYRDPFGRKHVSNFCYSYIYSSSERRGFNRMCGPDSYNQYT
jgi:hypothetical protein